MLRSKSPDLVLQEIWGHLRCHYAIRVLMTDAARHGGHDPDRVLFTAALRITRTSIAQQGAFPPDDHHARERLWQHVRSRLLTRLNPCRRARAFSRGSGVRTCVIDDASFCRPSSRS